MRRTKLAAVALGAAVVAGAVILPAASASAWNYHIYDGEMRCSGTYNHINITTATVGPTRHEIYDGVGAYVGQWPGSSSSQVHATTGPANYSTDQTVAYDVSLSTYNRHCGLG